MELATNQEVKQQLDFDKGLGILENLLARQGAFSLSKRLAYELALSEKTTGPADRDRAVGSVLFGLCRLKNQMLFGYQAIEKKTESLVTAVGNARKAGDFLLMGLAAKALLEHAASVTYLVNQTSEFVEQVEGKDDARTISASIGALYKVYARRLYSSRFFEGEEVVEPVDVRNLVLQNLSPYIEKADEYFDYVADFVHPDFDSSVTLPDTAGDGVMRPSMQDIDSIAENIFGLCGVVAEHLIQKEEELASLGVLIDAYVRRAHEPRIKVSRIFQAHLSDAPSRQSATFFDKDGKVWLKLADGTVFETPVRSIGDVTPEQEVTLVTKDGKTWVCLDDGSRYETPLGPLTSREKAAAFTQDGRVWLRLSDGTAVPTPMRSLDALTPEQKVVLFDRTGKVWARLNDGAPFETILDEISARQPATFFNKEGKIWARLKDGTAFPTDVKSLGDVAREQELMLSYHDGKVWLTLDDGRQFDVALEGLSATDKATFFAKEGKVWARLGDNSVIQIPVSRMEDLVLDREATFSDIGGNVWVTLDDGTSFETGLKDLAALGSAETGTCRQKVQMEASEGRVWLKLGDGTRVETPFESMEDVGGDQPVTLFSQSGRIWLRMGETSFETPLRSFTSRQSISFSLKDGKVWAGLRDGSSFETPFKTVGDVARMQTVGLRTAKGKTYLVLNDGSAHETPLKPLVQEDRARLVSKEGKVWAVLRDGRSFPIPESLASQVMSELQVLLFTKGGKVWLKIGDGISFPTSLDHLVSRRKATFFTRDGKVWLNMGDGVVFETAIRSIGDVAINQMVTLFTRRGKVWIRVGQGTGMEMPLRDEAGPRTATFFTRKAKVWLKF